MRLLLALLLLTLTGAAQAQYHRSTFDPQPYAAPVTPTATLVGLVNIHRTCPGRGPAQSQTDPALLAILSQIASRQAAPQAPATDPALLALLQQLVSQNGQMLAMVAMRGGNGPLLSPPVTGAPLLTPPVTGPPLLTPPVTGPPAITPPVVGPPAITPPVTGPPAIRPPTMYPAPVGMLRLTTALYPPR